MDLTVADVVAAMERLHPTGTAQSWDRVGLVAGDLGQPVRRIHLAVDPTLAVIDEARAAGADLLITHHPLLLRGVHSVATTTAKGASVTALLVNDIALYVAHTNADVASPGVSDALAAACGLVEVEPLVLEEGQPLGRVGDLPDPVTLAAFADRLAGALPPAPVGVRVAGDPGATVHRVAVLGGAGDGQFADVRACGADVYVTADLRHHPALEAREEAAATSQEPRDGSAATSQESRDGSAATSQEPRGVRGRRGTPYLVDAGHWASEWLWLPVLAERLPRELGDRGTTVDFHVSTVVTDPWDFVVGARSPEHGR